MSKPVLKAKDLRFLVVGLGSIGTRHLNNLHRLGATRLAALRTRKLQPPAELLPKDVRFFDSWEDAVASGIDAVVVGNPTSLHLETARKALEAGCHVYLEKPVSHTLEGCDELVALAEKTKRVVLVGCQLRWHPHFEKLQGWLARGELGRISSVWVDLGEHLPDWHPWEDYRTSYAARADLGGGVILTLIHELDFLYALFGPFKSVYALGGHLTPLELQGVEDTALMLLKGRDGTPIQLRMDYWRKPPVRRTHIVGAEGEAVWDYQARTLKRSRAGATVYEDELPADWDRNQLFLAAMTEFLESIEGRREPRTPLRAGVDVLRLAEAAKTSIKSGEVKF